MADHGKLYYGFDDEFVKAMATLCAKADIIVPNITEACFMTGMEYKTEYNEAYIKEAYFQSEGYVKVTINILKEYYERINKYKKEKESFEFIDISKFAINLVKENKDIQKEIFIKQIELANELNSACAHRY